jgi:hypothetical protein
LQKVLDYVERSFDMTTVCQREQEVINAIKGNNWDEGLRRHAEQCPVCSATLSIVPMMEQLRSETMNEPAHLPSAQLIWIRAQFSKRQEKLSMLDLFTLIGAVITGMAGIIGIIIWKIPGLLQSIPGFNDQQSPSVIDVAPVGIPILVIVGGLLIYAIFSDAFAVER